MAAKLPRRLYDVARAKTLDDAATEIAGIEAFDLMWRAGTAVFKMIDERWPQVRRLVIVCGPGDNAGDGYVVAALAARAGFDVEVVQITEPATLSAAARACLAEMVACDVTRSADLARIGSADLIVDAVFGIGLNRPIGDRFAEVIDVINRAPTPVVSVDVPSGLNADTGVALGRAVRADITLTFIALKQGLLTADGPDYCGDLLFDDLQLPEDLYDDVDSSASLFDLADARAVIVPRERTAHKGDQGHVLVVGGSPGYAGAIRLAGEAAARSGAGLVSIATHPAVANSVATARPELMVHAIDGVAELRQLLDRVQVVVIGPGLAQSTAATQMLASVLESSLPLVVDADALNLLAREPQRRENWILTPHPGEASRLLQRSTQAIHENRFQAARDLQQQFGGSIVLKGAGTIIADGNGIEVLQCGNPGMASGGMGDVLSGVIAALIAQGIGLHEAAKVGACLHSSAADRAALDAERGMLASDLMPHLRALMN